MIDFLDRLKKVMVAEAEENNFSACEYFETLLQHKDKLKPLLDDAEKFSDVNIQYICDEDSYAEGYFTIYFYSGHRYANHKYKLELLYDQRYWGYCECQPTDEGYDPIHQCCGDGCDWTAPMVTLEKIETVASFAFDGFERDMWELQKKWNGKEDLENERLSRQKQYIDEQIQRLLEERELIESKLR